MNNNWIKVTLDGKQVEVPEGSNLVDVARENGINIPTLCYFKTIEPTLGTCRICTVLVNGRYRTGCSVKLEEGMEVLIGTEELIDNRKAIIEMLYAEGNHFCPSCEKSGHCELQDLGYDYGITSTRYPHVFRDKIVDFNPERMIMESNRCILCKRCVEEVVTDDGKNVFSFVKRGNMTTVQIDYEQEKKLSDEQAINAMNLCPVGAILVKGISQKQPAGHRPMDNRRNEVLIDLQSKLSPPVDGKYIIATTSLAGCFGCHMSLLDIDTGLLDMLELVEFNKSPINDIKHFTKRCHIGIIEGGCANSENVEVLKKFRENCDLVISMGECAIMGGIPAMRNFIPLRECLEEAYLNGPTTEIGASIIPAHEDIPSLLDRVYPCNEIVKIDYYIPGCPPSAQHIWKVVKNILLGETFSLIHEEFKYD